MASTNHPDISMQYSLKSKETYIQEIFIFLILDEIRQNRGVLRREAVRIAFHDENLTKQIHQYDVLGVEI